MRFEVKGALFQLNKDELMQICDFLEMSGLNREEMIGKTPNALVSNIIQYIERDEISELEDQGMSGLLVLMDMIKTVQDASKSYTSEGAQDNEEREKLKEELEQLKLMVQQKETEMQERAYTNTNRTVNEAAHANISQWRKDYKISGQIGEPGQKDRLTFSSLALQIENGLSKGYPESEIVDAVIRAIVPGLQLRSYLEGKTYLSIQHT